MSIEMPYEITSLQCITHKVKMKVIWVFSHFVNDIFSLKKFLKNENLHRENRLLTNSKETEWRWRKTSKFVWPSLTTDQPPTGLFWVRFEKKWFTLWLHRVWKIIVCVCREQTVKPWWACCQEKSWVQRVSSSQSLCLRSTCPGCGWRNTLTRKARCVCLSVCLSSCLSLTVFLFLTISHSLLQACMLVFYPDFDVPSSSACDEVVLLLDTSESMRGESLRTAQRLALQVLKTLDHNLRLNVIIFGTGQY